MNEIIINQVCGVLDKYGKNYSEVGVLANLRSWENNKGWLVELLRRHPNWNEEALAVIHEVTHSREIDRSTVNYHKHELAQLVDGMEDMPEDERSRLHGALYTIIGTYSKTLPDTDRATMVKEYCGIHCAVGQKTSRVINAICKKIRAGSASRIQRKVCAIGGFPQSPANQTHRASIRPPLRLSRDVQPR